MTVSSLSYKPKSMLITWMPEKANLRPQEKVSGRATPATEPILSPWSIYPSKIKAHCPTTTSSTIPPTASRPWNPSNAFICRKRQPRSIVSKISSPLMAYSKSCPTTMASFARAITITSPPPTMSTSPCRKSRNTA